MVHPRSSHSPLSGRHLHNYFMNNKNLIISGSLAMLALAGACTGRTKENMEPTGETVRVVIPTQDIAQDSAIANGGEETIEQPATPDRK